MAAPHTGHDPGPGDLAVRRDRGELAAALAARCRTQLEHIAATGGPEVDQHLADLRRALLRRVPPSVQHTRQVDAAIAAIRGERGAGPGVSRRTLVRDLRDLERALGRAAAIGIHPPVGTRSAARPGGTITRRRRDQ